MLTIHHLGRSQSERILWLCEELGVEYAMVRHERDSVTRLSPPAMKALHPMGAAPLIEDGDGLLGESGAIMDYIVAVHGGGRLTLRAGDPEFAAYLYWLHFANATLQPAMGRCMILGRLNLDADNTMLVATRGRLERALAHVDRRLGAMAFFAGQTFTIADIMSVFSLTTMRLFHPVDLAPYPNVLAYLRRIGERPAYRRAMERGDPGFTPMLA